jgi:uncharacterized membrane protein
MNPRRRKIQFKITTKSKILFEVEINQMIQIISCSMDLSRVTHIDLENKGVELRKVSIEKIAPRIYFSHFEHP